MDIVIADRGRSDVIISIMTEADVRTALANSAGHRHRLWSARRTVRSPVRSRIRAGGFTRILGHYVREEHVLTLEDAVRRFTSRPAIRVGITDRGVIRPGMKATTIFDPATVRDGLATFEDPAHYSEGVSFVLVNGQAVVDSGKIAEARARAR